MREKDEWCFPRSMDMLVCLFTYIYKLYELSACVVWVFVVLFIVNYFIDYYWSFGHVQKGKQKKKHITPNPSSKLREFFRILNKGSNSHPQFCFKMAFPYIKYTYGISTSKLGPLCEPLVKLVTSDPYGQVMNDLAVC